MNLANMRLKCTPVRRKKMIKGYNSALKLEKKCNFKSTKTHYLHFQKWQKINFCTRKKFKTTKNAFFKTEITLFSTFQLNVCQLKMKLYKIHPWTKKWKMNPVIIPNLSKIQLMQQILTMEFMKNRKDIRATLVKKHLLSPTTS